MTFGEAYPRCELRNAEDHCMPLRSLKDRLVGEHLMTENLFLQICFFVFANFENFLLKQISQNCKTPKSPTCNGEDGWWPGGGRGMVGSRRIRDSLSRRVFYPSCCRFCNFYKFVLTKKQKTKNENLCRLCPGSKNFARRPSMMSSLADLNFPEIYRQYQRLQR